MVVITQSAACLLAAATALTSNHVVPQHTPLNPHACAEQASAVPSPEPAGPTPDAVIVPEPGSLALASAAAACCFRRRRHDPGPTPA